MTDRFVISKNGIQVEETEGIQVFVAFLSKNLNRPYFHFVFGKSAFGSPRIDDNSWFGCSIKRSYYVSSEDRRRDEGVRINVLILDILINLPCVDQCLWNTKLDVNGNMRSKVINLSWNRILVSYGSRIPFFVKILSHDVIGKRFEVNNRDFGNRILSSFDRSHGRRRKQVPEDMVMMGDVLQLLLPFN